MSGEVRLPRKLVIAGSRGRMGKLFLEKARELGIETAGADRPYDNEDALADALAGAELVMLSVPAANLADVTTRLARDMDKNAILCDVTSVKEGPMTQMEAAWPGQVVGTHPLFGPSNPPGADLPVAIVRGSRTTPEAVEMVGNFFIKAGCRVFETDARTHDQAMAKIQNMNFITNLAYFALLAGQEDLKPFLTPSFERRRGAAAKSLTEDAQMFAGLFEANEYSHEAVRQFRKVLNLAASGDIELLCKKAQWWWPEYQKKMAATSASAQKEG